MDIATADPARALPRRPRPINRFIQPFSPEDGGRLSGGAIYCQKGFVVFNKKKLDSI